MVTIVDFLFSRPILFIRQVAYSLVIPFKTAQDYIEKLSRAGVVREITGYARKWVYRSDEILKVIG